LRAARAIIFDIDPFNASETREPVPFLTALDAGQTGPSMLFESQGIPLQVSFCFALALLRFKFLKQNQLFYTCFLEYEKMVLAAWTSDLCSPIVMRLLEQSRSTQDWTKRLLIGPEDQEEHHVTVML
jgi:hypothetical protein